MGNFDFKVGTQPVPELAFPGLYPIYYVTQDGGILCPKCVNANLGLCADSSDSQWYVIASDINYDNDGMQCDNCGCQIESAYGEKE